MEASKNGSILKEKIFVRATVYFSKYINSSFIHSLKINKFLTVGSRAFHDTILLEYVDHNNNNIMILGLCDVV